MKLKTVVLAATLLAACCCALTSYGRAPTGQAKPKKKATVTSGSGTITVNGVNGIAEAIVTTNGVMNTENAATWVANNAGVTISRVILKTNNLDVTQSALYFGNVSGTVSQTTTLSGATSLSGATLLSVATVSVSNPPALPPGAYYAFNSDGVYSNADLQALINYLKTGQGSTSTVTSSDSSSEVFMNSYHSSGTLAFAGYTAQPNFIPEPTSAILAGCGLVALLAARRRLRNGSAS